MHASIEPLGGDLLCRSPDTRPAEIRLDGDLALTVLEDWANRYESAVHSGDAAALLGIGRELFDWLDDAGWATAWVRATGSRSLQIRVDDPNAPLGRALLDAPWELLATKDGHLADDAVQLLELVRRIGAVAEPIAPRYSDLQLLFMTAAPTGQSVLSYEAEETAILEATERLPLHLVVEESGAAPYLGERLDLDGPFEALHLSCHGDIDPERGPLLALEDEVGELKTAGPGELAQLLGDPGRTPLVFLSACRTAEQLDAADDAHRFEPFARELIRAGVANVIGWDGSVYDTDAMAFARCLYGALSGGRPIPVAAAKARLALRQAALKDPQRGQHWHLARLYLGPNGGGALTGRRLARRKLPGERHEAQFLDVEHGEVPVARRAEFVGRRRQAQAILRAFRDIGSGVLIHGMGSLGKFSLAARIASRMTGHRCVVIFRRYDALSVFDRVVDAIPAQWRKAARDTWRDAVLADQGMLAEALEALLDESLDRDPILLIVDDLESILETPGESDIRTPVQADCRPPLAAILSAFGRAQTNSRLLITSRYRFTLPDGRGGDLADDLTAVALRPMDGIEQRKQLSAITRAAQLDALTEQQQRLAAHALRVAGGNPGLQATLITPILNGEPEAPEQALAAIEHYQRTGAPPEAIRALMAAGAAKDASNAILAFFRRMAFETYRKALSADQARMLSAARVFSADLPMPRTALEAAGIAGGVDEPAVALDRLLALGLADDWGRLDGTEHAAANPLARPLVDAPGPDQSAVIGAAALPVLTRTWIVDGAVPRDPRAAELTRLALVAPEPDPDLLNSAAEAAARWLFDTEQDARRAQDAVLRPSLDWLAACGAEPSHGLLLIAADCAERLGETEARERALGLMRGTNTLGAEGAASNLYIARREVQLGNLEAASGSLEAAASGFREAGQQREWAIVRGEIADILQARGQLDEALRIRTEDQLPVYERLGDIVGIAHVRYSAAQARLQRGDHQQGGLQQIYADLAESFALLQQLGQPDGIGAVGMLLAQVLAMGGQKDQALQVLDQAENAFGKLGAADSVEQVSQLRTLITR